MAHRYTMRDVERALQRYRDLTGDHSAKLELGKSQTRIAAVPPTTIYRVTESTGLRGFEAYGAFSAYNALALYCNGFEDGRAAGPKTP